MVVVPITLTGDIKYMSDNSLEVSDSFQSENRKRILEKLKSIPKDGSVVSVWVEDFKEQFLKNVDFELTESVKNLWFPNEEVKVNVEKITSDFRDTDLWEDILHKYKEGLIEDKDMVDYIVLSHIAVDPREVEPARVLSRQIESGLKSRVGVKVIKRLIEATNDTLKNSLGALCEALELPAQTEVKLLGSGISEDISDNEVIPENKEVKNALASVGENDNLFSEEEVVKQFFAGDIIYDKLIEVSYEELLDKLADIDDYEFDSVRTLILDAGMEQQNKAEKRTEYTENPEDLRFVLYTVWLSNIFDGFGGTHSDDRGVYKYRLKEQIKEEQFLMLMNMVKHRYAHYMEGRSDFSQIRMGWKTKDQIYNKITHPFSRLTPYDKDVIINTVYNASQRENDIKIIKDFFDQIVSM